MGTRRLAHPRPKWSLVTLLAAAGCATASPNTLVTTHLIPVPVEGNTRVPNRADLITISAMDLHPSQAATLFDRVADAVVSISGNRSRGSAFLITRDGLALTNSHVIARQENLMAQFRDGRALPVRVLRIDHASDVALVRISCNHRCRTVSLGDAESFAVGSDVYIVGTPLSEFFSHSLTKGIVSGLRFRKGATLIQTDAAINPGNSGGPIVNASSGRVIGIVSTKLVRSDIEGIGFGITIVDALRVLGVRPAASVNSATGQ